MSGVSAARDDAAPRVEGRLPPVRPRQGGCASRSASWSLLTRGADDPLLLARREAEHGRELVAHRPGRLRHDRRRPSSTARATPPATGRPTTTPPTGSTSRSSSCRSGWASATRSTPRSDFVLAPLRSIPDQPAAAARDRDLRVAASPTQQTAWTTPTQPRSAKASANGTARLDLGPAGSYGPVAGDDGARCSASRRAAGSTARC